MKARQLIDGADAFDPDQLKIINQAFDEAWTCVKPLIGDRKSKIDYARVRLANILLVIAQKGVGDAETLREAALKVLRADPTVFWP